jgi:hypothetical protein
MTLDNQKYLEELDKMRKAEPKSVELCPLEAVAIINHVQIAAENTNNCKITQIAINGARKIQKAVLDLRSTAYEVLEARWQAVK